MVYPPPPGSAAAAAAPAVAAAVTITSAVADAAPAEAGKGGGPQQAPPPSPLMPDLTSDAAPRTPQKSPEEPALQSPRTEPLDTRQSAVSGLAPSVDLKVWQAKGQAKGQAKALALNWTLADILGSDGFVFLLLAVFLYAILACLSAEPPAPLPECTWRWKAFRCSAGCKVRMHAPMLQGPCTPM